MKVLVTGATSMLGRATADRLIGRGDEVTVMQRRPSGIDTTEILGDIATVDVVARAVDGQDAVIHVAAKVAVTGPWSEFQRVNIAGTETLLTAARHAGVGRFVHVSTPSVAHAGHALVGARADDADPLTTRGHYATSKAEAEALVLAASTSECSVVAIRPHLVWGPGDEQLVGRIVDRARSGRLALVGSGSALVDTTYVDNAADALVAAVDSAPSLGGRAFVVSNGEPRTVHELVGRILLAHGLTAPIRTVPRRVAFGGGLLVERWWERTGREGDPPMTSFLAEQLSTAHWFDQRMTRVALNWKPSIGLDDGFRRLATWFNRPA